MGDVRFWLDVAVFLPLGFGALAVVAMAHHRRHRAALQAGQAPERGWIWVYLFGAGWMAEIAVDALEDVFSQPRLFLMLKLVPWLFILTGVMGLLIFVIKPAEARKGRRL